MPKALSIAFLPGAILLYRRYSLDPTTLCNNDRLFDGVNRKKVAGILCANGVLCYQLEHRPFRLTVYTQDYYTDKVRTTAQVIATLAANLASPMRASDLDFGFRIICPFETTSSPLEIEDITTASALSAADHAAYLREQLGMNPRPQSIWLSQVSYAPPSQSIWKKDDLPPSGLIEPMDYASQLHHYIYGCARRA